MAGADAPHALYRFWGEGAVLLYVGITADPGRRWRQHADDKPWWADVVNVTLEWFPDRDAVLAAEREAIRSEGPRYNVAQVPAKQPVTSDLPDWPECSVCGASAWCWSIDAAAAYGYEARLAEFNAELIEQGNPVGSGGVACVWGDLLDQIPAPASVVTFCEQHADQADYDFRALGWRELVASVGHILANHEKLAAGTDLGWFLERVSSHGSARRHP